jgi:hypothetical protein
MIYPDVVLLGVSKAAQKEADRLGETISDKTWRHQPKFDPGRKVFHLEHVYPVSAIQKECELAQTEEAILGILKARLRIAWILKREDQELRRLGYRSIRPDPDAAYREAGIELREAARG